MLGFLIYVNTGLTLLLLIRAIIVQPYYYKGKLVGEREERWNESFIVSEIEGSQ